MRLLVVGAGATGCAVAHGVAQRPALAHVQVQLWEKSRGVGGRMTTARSTAVPAGRADTGAQYFTRPAATPFGRVYDDLTAAGVLAPLQGAIVGQSPAQQQLVNLVAPSGASSVPRALLQLGGRGEVVADRRVVALDRVAGPTSGSGGLWRATAAAAADGAPGPSSDFDAVVLTIPAPQVLQLGGDLADLLEGAQLRAPLGSVRYTTRFALALFFSAADADRVATALPFAARYVDAAEDDVVRYIAVSNRLRAAGSHPVSAEASPSVVVHSSVSFGAAHADQAHADVAPILLAHLQRLAPALPLHAELRSHKWLYSQVAEPLHTAKTPTSPYGAYAVHGGPPLILAGDYLTMSNLDGCLASADAAVQLLESLVHHGAPSL